MPRNPLMFEHLSNRTDPSTYNYRFDLRQREAIVSTVLDKRPQSFKSPSHRHNTRSQPTYFEKDGLERRTCCAIPCPYHFAADDVDRQTTLRHLGRFHLFPLRLECAFRGHRREKERHPSASTRGLRNRRISLQATKTLPQPQRTMVSRVPQ